MLAQKTERVAMAGSMTGRVSREGGDGGCDRRKPRRACVARGCKTAVLRQGERVEDEEEEEGRAVVCTRDIC